MSSVSNSIQLELKQQFSTDHYNTSHKHDCRAKLNLTFEVLKAADSHSMSVEDRLVANEANPFRFPIKKTIDADGNIALEIEGKPGPIAFCIKDWKFESVDMSKGMWTEVLLGFGFSVDNKKPEYIASTNQLKNQQERDGTAWVVTQKEGKNYVFDQNGGGKYQFALGRSIQDGAMSTTDVAFGKEKTTDNTGLMFLSIQIFERAVTYRSVTRSDDGPGVKPVLARFGYGHTCNTPSKTTNFKFAKNSQIWTIPMRFYINEPIPATVPRLYDHDAMIVAETPVKAKKRDQLEVHLGIADERTEQDIAIDLIKEQFSVGESTEVKRQKMLKGEIPLIGNFVIPKPK